MRALAALRCQALCPFEKRLKWRRRERQEEEEEGTTRDSKEKKKEKGRRCETREGEADLATGLLRFALRATMREAAKKDARFSRNQGKERRRRKGVEGLIT